MRLNSKVMFMFVTHILSAGVILGQDIQKDSVAILTKNSVGQREMVVRFQRRNIDNAMLESLQATLQRIVGVPYVGVNYQTAEIIVRYDSAKVSFQRLMNIATRIRRPIAVVQNGVSVNNKNWLMPELSNITFECLAHDEARALCEKHFTGALAAGIELENCYVVKVDFQRVAHIDVNYDWLSIACLVENGQLQRPSSWLAFASGVDGNERSDSGLLIFPKIPVLGLGLTLRFLRVDGEGYDSFAIDLPQQ